VNDSQAMATLRNELLNKISAVYPSPIDAKQLELKCRMPFLTRDKIWYHDAVLEQLKILHHARLIRPFHGGYTLTETGRRDRAMAARFTDPGPEAA